MSDYDNEPEYEPEPDEEGEDYSEQVKAGEVRPVRAPQPPRQVVLPIGEAETDETMHGTVAFTRSLSLGGSRNDVAHLRVEMPFPIQPGWTPDQCAAMASDVCFQTKAVVLEQLGLEFTVDEGGILHEVIRHHFPEAKAEREPERRSRDRDDEDDDRPRRRGNSEFPHPRDIEKPRHVNADVWADLCDNFGDWWDNRPKKASGEYKSTASDFKRPDDQVSVWLQPPRRTASAGSGRRSYNN